MEEVLFPSRLVGGPGAPAQGGAALLQLPAVDSRWAYGLAYWRTTLRNLLVPHRLRPAAARPRSAVFTAGPQVHAQWAQLFGSDAPGATPAPYLVSQSCGTLLYGHLFADLGLNFRHLLHLGHVAWHHRPVVTGTQRVDVRLARVLSAGRGRALLVLHSEVHDTEGQAHCRVEDRFLVRGLAPAQLQGLAADTELQRDLALLPRLQPALTHRDTARVPLALAGNLGRRFGRLSGDSNPVHTTRLGARLVGQPQPFLQGLATRNLVVGTLARQGLAVGGLSISFCRPVALNQTVTLSFDFARFELTDQHQRVLAAGSFELARGTGGPAFDASAGS